MDLSVILTAHAEGYLAHRSLRSAFRSASFARRSNASVEILAILDSPNDATREYVANLADKGIRVEIIQRRDVSAARNRGIELATGSHVAFLDADDLIAENWLASALSHSRKEAAGRSVVVPTYTIAFEADSAIARHLSSNDPEFREDDLLENNCWTSILLAPRDLLLEIPFASAPSGSGIGFEDWHWFATVVAAGIPVVAVPKTCAFVRRKAEGSRLASDRRNHSLLSPSPFFQPDRFVVESPGSSDASSSALPARNGNPPRGRSRFDLLRRDGAAFRVGHYLLRRYPSSRPLVSATYRTLAWTRERWRGERRVDDWIVETWKAMHEIEPQLYPDEATLAELLVYQAPEPAVGKAYRELCLGIEGPVSHVFLVPWLKTGGSDLETLNYIALAREANPASRALVIATEYAESEWASRLPAGTTFVDFGRRFERLTGDERRALLARLLGQLGAKTVHNLNSRLGYEVFERYGKGLSRVTRLYASAFCEDVTPEGKHVGYALDEIPRCAPHLSAIFADNARILERMHETFAIPRDKLFVHYQPMNLGEVRARQGRVDGPLDVLWAGRLDRQKRPDLLVEIARRCRDLPIRFHAYGSPVIRGDRSSASLRGEPNIVVGGPFARFAELPIERFDLFLNTSQWDGLPNVLLEALSVGLPIVSSDAGGIGELVRDGETGILVSPFDDVERYVAELGRLVANRERLADLATRGRELLAERHSWDAFRAAVGSVGGYLSSEPATRDRPVVAAP